MAEPLDRACPECGESLIGDEVRGLPGRHEDLRVGVQLTYFQRHIVLIWRCPFCGHGWPRFSEGQLHDRAVGHLASENQTGFERRADSHDDPPPPPKTWTPVDEAAPAPPPTPAKPTHRGGAALNRPQGPLRRSSGGLWGSGRRNHGR